MTPPTHSHGHPHGNHHHGGQAAAKGLGRGQGQDADFNSLTTRVLAASAGLRIAMVLPAIALLWAAVAWALLGEG